MAEDKEKKYIKIGKRYEIKEGMAFECGLLPKVANLQEFCFKDEEVYLNEPNEICYVDDLCFHKWFDLVYNGQISEEEEEEVFEHCENDELQVFVWDKNRKASGLYDEAVWSHKSILKKCASFLKKNPHYAPIDPEDLAYKVFLDAKGSIRVRPALEGSPLFEPDSFTAAADALLK